MCINKPECQACETCGDRKWQFWTSSEMHPRGCHLGFDRMDRCPDAVNHAKRIRWAMDNGGRITEAGRSKVAQIEAAGVDLLAPVEDLWPYFERQQS